MEREKPYVIIDLEPKLQDFLYHEFGFTKVGEVELTRTKDIGEFINAMITISDRPPKIPFGDYPFKLYLPTEEYNWRILRENFIFVPKWKQKQIQDYLDACFKLRVREFFCTGYSKGYKQDKIIKAFLDNYDIKNNKINYDMIKKIDFRNRKNEIKKIREEIQLSLFELIVK